MTAMTAQTAMTATLLRRLAIVAALALVLSALGCAATTPSPRPTTEIGRLGARHAELLARYRPDLAQAWNIELPANADFVGLSESTVDGHVRTLRSLVTQVKALPGDAQAETLCSRLEREIAETQAGGALRTDALLWLDIVGAAARAPVLVGRASGCERTIRISRQLRAVPEALRAAAILLRGSHPPTSRAFEERVGRVEWLLRQDLASRTEACREPRRLVEFARADTLAARALATFRQRVLSGS